MSDWPLTISAMLFVPAAASFITTSVDRVPRGQTIFWDRSNCDDCGTDIAPLDLIPVFSYCRLRGRCRHCGSRIPARHLIVEAIAFTIGTLSLMAIGATDFAVSLPLGLLLIALACFDARYGRLPNLLTLGLLGLGLFFAPAITGLSATHHLLGALVGFAAPAAIAWLYRSLRGYDGLGGGDIKLFATAGAWVGPSQFAIVVLAASCIALAYAAGTGLRSRTASLPFGPFIAAGLWGVWCAGFILGRGPS